MFQYRGVLVRMRQGDTDREIAFAGLMGRPKAARLRALAADQGCARGVECFGRVLQARGDVFAREAGIVLQEVLFRPALPEQSDDEVDGKPRPADHRFAGQDVRVDPDPVLPRHAKEDTSRGARTPLASRRRRRPARLDRERHAVIEAARASPRR